MDMCAPVLAEQMSIEVKQARVGNSAFFYIACHSKIKSSSRNYRVWWEASWRFHQHNFVMPQRAVPTMPSYLKTR